MFSAVVRSNIRRVARVSQNSVAIRSLGFFDVSKDRDIPTDEENAWGRRKWELEWANEGKGDFYEEGALVPAANAGTAKNPIVVTSAMEKRAVGYEDPNTHQIVWFNLKKGPLHFVPEVNLYFKLNFIGEEHAHGHHGH